MLRNLTGRGTKNDCHSHNQSSFHWLETNAETHTQSPVWLEYGLPEFGGVAKGHIKNEKKDLKRSPSKTCFPLAVAVFSPHGNLNGK
ncbi:MAG: hypothetical protein HOP19_14335 [Acidobacteria bacterium]|nr:hypothetical protein [Acidobacteriota bacterium]